MYTQYFILTTTYCNSKFIFYKFHLTDYQNTA